MPTDPTDPARLMRPDGGRGVSLAERIGASLERLHFRGPLHRLRLTGQFPLKLRAVPVDPVAGDAEAGERIAGGRLFHAGFGAAAATVDFDDPAAPAAWRDWAHGFGWLRDLAVARDRRAGAPIAEAIARRWLATHAEVDDLAWRADLAGRRTLFWTAYAPYLIASNDLVHRSTVLNALARWGRHLDRAAAKAPVGLPAVEAACGLAVGGLLLPGGEARVMRGEAAMAAALADAVADDGAPASRAPEAALALIETLALTKAAYASVKAEPPPALADALGRLGAGLVAATLGDARLAAWHGGGASTVARVAAAAWLAGPDACGAVPGASGLVRIAAGATVLLVEAGPPPPARLAAQAHASTLAFELSDGVVRLVTGCGAPSPAGKALPTEFARALRTTAAHSTLALADGSSTRILADGALGRGVEAVTIDTRASEAGHWLDARHDGWRRRHGFDHARALYLSADGTDLRGEDRLVPVGRARRRAGVAVDARFHLGVGVEPTMTADRQGALLRLPGGRLWSFRARGGTLAIDDSVVVDGDGAPRPIRQLVLQATAAPEGVTLAWGFKRQG